VGAAVERAIALGDLLPGVAPHWLPFVHVDDVDKAIDVARNLGAPIPMQPKDIMNIGRSRS
jgi:predicted enzyme related to lactoylglutathione lyase